MPLLLLSRVIIVITHDIIVIRRAKLVTCYLLLVT
jgi:hypothetical protein